MIATAVPIVPDTTTHPRRAGVQGYGKKESATDGSGTDDAKENAGKLGSALDLVARDQRKHGPICGRDDEERGRAGSAWPADAD